MTSWDGGLCGHASAAARSGGQRTAVTWSTRLPGLLVGTRGGRPHGPYHSPPAPSSVHRPTPGRCRRRSRTTGESVPSKSPLKLCGLLTIGGSQNECSLPWLCTASEISNNGESAALVGASKHDERIRATRPRDAAHGRRCRMMTPPASSGVRDRRSRRPIVTVGGACALLSKRTASGGLRVERAECPRRRTDAACGRHVTRVRNHWQTSERPHTAGRCQLTSDRCQLPQPAAIGSG